MSNQQPRQPIVVTHQGGARFAAQVRSHRVLVDQPLAGGGDDTAPTPLELLAVSLGTCIAFYVRQFCHVRGISYDGMRIEIGSHPAASPSRIGRFVVRVVLPPELPVQYAAMLQRVAQSCPAHNTLTHGAEISIELEMAEPAAA